MPRFSSAHPVSRFGLAALVLAGALAASAAQAQPYYDDGYDYGPPPPPRRVYRYDDEYYGPRRPPPPPRSAGLNCDAIQPGFTGPRPFSCPLPGPRPLGTRCFCNTPVAPLSGGQTVAGHVVP